MLKTIKRNLLESFKAARLFDFSGSSRWRKNRLLILAYHGVSLEDEHLWDSSLFMPAEILRRRFELIEKNGCKVLPLGEAIEKLYDGALPEKSVVITFDDGNYDFFRLALPIIEEFGFPATVYLTTYYSEFNKPVFGVAADYLLWKAKDKTLRLNELIGLNEQIALSDDGERRRAHQLIVARAADREFSAARKDELLAALCAELGIDYAEFCGKRVLQLMNRGEAAAVAAAGIDVQLHTHRHRVPLDENSFRREIEDNRRAIARATADDDSRIKHFCYPSGEHDARFFPWMKAANIVSATTCETALASAATDPLLLPRLIDTCSLSEIEFEGWLTGVSQFLPQRKNL